MTIAILLSALLLATCTATHYGALRAVANRIGPSCIPGRALFYAVAGIALAHVLEAGLYAGGFWFAVHVADIGTLEPSANDAAPPGWMDYFYFSLVNFTTLGRGDLVPQAHLRFMTAMEAFHGFLLITASGSFVLQVMAGKNPFLG
ncbi:MAG: ion channel [Shimia sp.]